MNATMELLQAHRSIRKFKDQPLADGLLVRKHAWLLTAGYLSLCLSVSLSLSLSVCLSVCRSYLMTD